MDSTDNPETTLNSKKSKIFLFSGIVIALVLVGVGGYVLGNKNQFQPQPTPLSIISVIPTPDSTANWKTYTDSKYGFSFKYPESWYKATENLATEDKIITISFVTSDPKKSGNLAGVQVIKYLNPTGLSLSDWWNNRFVNSGYGKEVVSNLKNIIIDSLPALRQEPDAAPENIEATYIYISTNDSIFEIIGSNDITKQDNSKQNFDQILSTLKFLSSASPGQTGQPDETTNWKSYTDNTLGIKFKYPDTWNLETSKTGIGIFNYDRKDTTPPESGIYKEGAVNIFIGKVDNEILTINQLKETLKENEQNYYKDPLLGNLNYEGSANINGYTVFTREYNDVYNDGTILKVNNYFFDEKGKVIDIGLYVSVDMGRKTYNQILSTFKFL